MASLWAASWAFLKVGKMAETMVVLMVVSKVASWVDVKVHP